MYITTTNLIFYFLDLKLKMFYHFTYPDKFLSSEVNWHHTKHFSHQACDLILWSKNVININH